MAKKEATLLLRIKQTGSEVLDKLKSSFVITAGDIANAVQNIGGKIVDFAKEAINSFAEEERAINQLTQSMINQGVFTSELRSEYLKLADSISQVTEYSDDQVVAAQSVLQSYIGERKVTQDLIMATANLAAVKKIDLATASELVGKTIGTETNALARQGIQIDSAADSGTKMAQVISEINKKWKDQAEVAVQGLGAIKQSENAWGDFMDVVGQRLSGFTIDLAKSSSSIANFLTKFLSPDFDSSKATIGEMQQRVLKLRQEWISLEEQAAKGPFGADGAQVARIRDISKEIDTLKQKQAELRSQEETAAAAKVENEKVNAEKLRAEKLAQGEKDIEQLAVQEAISADTELNAKYKLQESIIANSTNQADRLKAIRTKQAIEKQTADKMEVLSEEEKNKLIASNRANFLNQIATMQNSNNKVMAAAGKAAAIAQITISTAQAADAGYAWGMTAGGPILAGVFRALAYAAGAANIARVNGVQLAEGGIVMPSQGGTQATIGEGGRAEAVIPLPDGFDPDNGLSGGGVTVNFNGPIMGDQNQAKEFARMLDRELLDLRRSNQSVAFDSQVI